MFGKKDDDALLNQSGRSFIAETMQIDGDIHTSGAVDVAGLLNGSIHANEMIIFDTGSVKGNLYAKKLIINCYVEGEIVVDEISLGKNSVIRGDILFKTYLKKMLVETIIAIAKTHEIVAILQSLIKG